MVPFVLFARFQEAPGESMSHPLPPPDLFDRIRAAAAEVARRSQRVRIDRARLAAYAAALPSPSAAPGIDPDRHWLDRGDETVAFFLTLNAVNFGSGWFPVLRKRPGMSGYFTVASSLTDAYRARGGPLAARELADIDTASVAAILGQDPDGPAGELMTLFARAWNDLGRLVRDEYGGAFPGLVADAGGSAARLVALLERMPFYRDVSRYGDLEVPFYKRAQITAADLAMAFDRRGPGAFRDLDRMTIFADNLVPHVLRLDGILVYDDGLAARIDAGELIAAGSPEEVEIRAGAVHAVELLRDELGRLGRSTTSMELDYLLWTRGQQPFYKQTKPRHRARGVWY